MVYWLDTEESKEAKVLNDGHYCTSSEDWPRP